LSGELRYADVNQWWNDDKGHAGGDDRVSRKRWEGEGKEGRKERRKGGRKEERNWRFTWSRAGFSTSVDHYRHLEFT